MAFWNPTIYIYLESMKQIFDMLYLIKFEF
jgi:hypothetical protein